MDDTDKIAAAILAAAHVLAGPTGSLDADAVRSGTLTKRYREILADLKKPPEPVRVDLRMPYPEKPKSP